MNVQLEEWIIVQGSVNIICCCLPTYGPFLPKSSTLGAQLASCYQLLASVIPKMRRIPRRITTDPNSYDESLGTRQYQYAHPFEEVRDYSPFRTSTTMYTRSKDNIELGKDFPANAIQVRRSIELTYL